MSVANRRTHLGSGALVLQRNLSVFINCPYDEGFRPLFHAAIFSTICCGFIPRAAIESGTAAMPRMDRIVRALMDSKYSIHDFTRCRGIGEENFARFNMPLELGIAMAQRFAATQGGNGDSRDAAHDWLLLIPRGHAYRSFVSDLSGYDPAEHDGSVVSLVPVIMAWLATRPDAVLCPTPHAVLEALPDFQNAMQKLSTAWCDHMPWVDVLMEALRVARDADLIPLGAPVVVSPQLEESLKRTD